MKFMSKSALVKIALIFLFVCFPINSVSASVEGDMNDFFNKSAASANVTGPAAYSSQAGGYYTGGSVWARFPQETLRAPFNIQLPSAKGGCGGIDLFTGSFSFIDGDQIIAMMKAVANNAVGFSFQLAIDAISQEIGVNMKDLRNVVQSMNQQQMSSCQAAALAVGSVWPKQQESSAWFCSNLGREGGQFRDQVAAKWGCNDQAKQNQVLATSNTDIGPSTPRNYTWYALKTANNNMTREFAEFLMTLTGTVIFEKPIDSNSSGKWNFFGAASNSVLTGLLDGTASTGPISVMSCVGDTSTPDGCLQTSVRLQNIAQNASFNARVNQLISSMSNKVRSNQSLTPDEISLLGMVSLPLYKIITVHAAAEFGISTTVLSQLSEIVAIDLLINSVEKMLDKVQASQKFVDTADMKHFDAWRSGVVEFRSQLHQRASRMNATFAQTYQIVERTQFLERTLKSKLSPSMSASLKFGRSLSAQGIR
jgi:conjugative transfer pilus assembly protein TraH